MAIFSRREEEETVKPPTEEEIRESLEASMPHEEESNVTEADQVVRKLERQERSRLRPFGQVEPFPTATHEDFAPLFVKLDKYKEILGTVAQLKHTVAIARNSLHILDQLARLRDENLRVIKTAVENVEEDLAALDTGFMRPGGYKEPRQTEDLKELDKTLNNLQGQIKRLKTDVENFG